jgi:hypothetical protein
MALMRGTFRSGMGRPWWVWRMLAKRGQGSGPGGDTTPGGASGALLLENGNGIELEGGSGVLLLEV